MANEVKISFPSGSNLYFIVRQDDGDVWYIVGDVFENWGGGAGRDMDDYDIAMTDETGSFYQANFDTDIPAGVYTVQIFLRETGTPLDADPILDAKTIYWTGSAELTESQHALQVDTIAEMSAGAPPVTPTQTQILNFIYRLFRNKTITTSGLLTVRNDADGADLYKATIGNDGTTFTKQEYVSG